MYEIVFYEKAKRQFERLPSELKNRIVANLERIKFRPYYFIKRLVGTNYFRLRVGDYRLILDIQNKKMIIFVIEVGPRRNIYKR